MIRLTRINGKEFILNCDLIRTIESTPDTVITLTHGDKLMVKEDIDTVIRLVVEFRKRLYQEPPVKGDSNS